MMPSYFEVWKKRMNNNGGSVSQSILNNSKKIFTDNFKDDPSYRQGILRKSDLTEIPIDTRIVNVDKSTSEKRIQILPDNVCSLGDYIVYKDNTYITTEFENNVVVPYAKVLQCNQQLNWKGLKTPIPCILENSSYGSKGEIHNYVQQGDFDSRGIITVQRNSDTDIVYEGMRFYMGSEWDIYEVTKKQGAFKKGCWQLICKYTKRVLEDDIENGIAFNRKLEYNNSSTLENYSIIGEEKVKINTESKYIISPLNENIKWTLDEDSIENNLATIVSQTNEECVIKILSKEKLVQLEARDLNNNLLAYFNMYGIK